MGTATHRVIQWATGNTGQRALREVIRDPALDLVGVLVYDPAKDGVDAGELCGEPATGILATTNRENVLALDADWSPRSFPPRSSTSPTICPLTRGSRTSTTCFPAA
jgi:2,4-diaminopentanoate dehydrogenase